MRWTERCTGNGCLTKACRAAGVQKDFTPGNISYVQWRNHWGKSGLVEVELADTLPDNEGANIFLKFERIFDGKLLQADAGRNISFVRIIARKIGDPKA